MKIIRFLAIFGLICLAIQVDATDAVPVVNPVIRYGNTVLTAQGPQFVLKEPFDSDFATFNNKYGYHFAGQYKGSQLTSGYVEELAGSNTKKEVKRFFLVPFKERMIERGLVRIHGGTLIAGEGKAVKTLPRSEDIPYEKITQEKTLYGSMILGVVSYGLAGWGLATVGIPGFATFCATSIARNGILNVPGVARVVSRFIK